jgi:hypothetical protein
MEDCDTTTLGRFGDVLSISRLTLSKGASPVVTFKEFLLLFILYKTYNSLYGTIIMESLPTCDNLIS